LADLKTALIIKPDRLQVLQAIKLNGKLKRLDFSNFMQDANFVSRLVFNDEAIFHLSG